MSEFPCFLIEPSRIARQWLRRYSTFDAEQTSCVDGQDGDRLHSAIMQIEDGVVVMHDDHYTVEETAWPRGDRRWPTTCDTCGYRFTDNDTWQLFHLLLWRRLDNREIVGHLHQSFPGRAPSGAMYFNPWHDRFDSIGPDGRSLVVLTPAGLWEIDALASSGGHWTRVGKPPLVTATPSIAIGNPLRYHAYLSDGVLRSTSDSPS